MDFHLSVIYRDVMPIAPKASKRKTVNIKDKYSHGWVYLAKDKNNFHNSISCRSLSTLSRLADENIFITPNSFWHSNKRNKDTLRWLNAYVLDFDDLLEPGSEIDLIDPGIVISHITKAGLPYPSFLNQTNTGVHAWWLFDKPVRAADTEGKVVTLYDSIHKDMVRMTHADPFFTSASQCFVRVPKKIIWSSMQRYSFETFKEWREINCEKVSNTKTYNVWNSGKWLDSPAIQALVTKDVNKGQRNCGCYTLSLAFKADKIEQETAVNALMDWNYSLTFPLPYREVMSTVSSAFNGKGTRPGRRYLSLLVGPELAYTKVRYITPPKPRCERSKWHLNEINDLIVNDLLDKKMIEESQADWAKRLGIPLRSFKLVLQDLRKSGIIFAITGRGRYAVSYYKLSETFLLHGKEAFLDNCEEVNKVSIEETTNNTETIAICAEQDELSVDNNVLNSNGAYSYKQVVSAGVGGTSYSLPRYLLKWLRIPSAALDYSWSSIALPVIGFLDTG